MIIKINILLFQYRNLNNNHIHHIDLVTYPYPFTTHNIYPFTTPNTQYYTCPFPNHNLNPNPNLNSNPNHDLYFNLDI